MLVLKSVKTTEYVLELPLISAAAQHNTQLHTDTMVGFCMYFRVEGGLFL